MRSIVWSGSGGLPLNEFEKHYLVEKDEENMKGKRNLLR